MIVIDASVVVDLLHDVGSMTTLQRRLVHEFLIAPDILPVEVVSGLRGLNLGGHLSDNELERATADLMSLSIDLQPSLHLVPRVLALRHNFSTYDASYVALAEAFDCTLLTYDRRLAKRADKYCTVEAPRR